MRTPRAGRGRPRAGGSSGVGAWFVGVLVAGVIGFVHAREMGGRFVRPEPLDPAQWNIVSPGRDESVTDPGLGRGTHVVDGSLVLRAHAFHRADMLVPRAATASNDPVAGAAPLTVARAEIALARWSGPVRVILHGGIGPTFVHLRPDAWGDSRAETWHPRQADGPWVVALRDGGVYLDGAGGGALVASGVAPGALELTAPGEEARIRSIRLVDPTGQDLVVEDFTRTRAGLGVGLVGAGVGALVAGAVGVIVRAGALPTHVRRQRAARARELVRVGLLLLPIVGVLTLPSGVWLAVVERLYLVRTPAWDLAKIALTLSMLPLACAALLATGVLRPTAQRGALRGAASPPSPEADAPDLHAPAAPLTAAAGDLAWGALAVGVAIVGVRRWTLPAAWVALPGALWLLAPWWLARRAGLDARGVLLRDLPALLAVATLGWGGGLFPAVLWRLLVLGASARTLLDAAPRAAADLLALTLLLLLPASELAARATYLDTAWDAAHLTGEVPHQEGWRTTAPFWEGTCGEGAGDPARGGLGVVFAGGSSTGGAYQLRGEPEAFFPARTHARLCAASGTRSDAAPVAIHTTNFGDSGRDTFTISRSIDHLLTRGAARVLVLYVGVNDALTSNLSLSRKQIEAETADRRAAFGGLAELAGRSRVLTGLGLLRRPPPGVGGEVVPGVPLTDAEENLRFIAKAAAAHDVRVVLVPEYVRADMRRQLAAYEALLHRVAQDLDGVESVDLTTALAPHADEDLLVDGNHLSRRGAERVAEVLAPVVAAQLGLAHDVPTSADGAPRSPEGVQP